MKKTALLITILLFIPLMLFATGSFWVLDATNWINPESGTPYYRFGFQTVMNLTDIFLQPTYSTDHYGNEQYISSKNAIATAGVQDCDHKINFTVSTNGGHFVSQSDPSKYRSYYVAISPDYSTISNPDSRYYYKYDEINSTSASDSTLLPNTKNNNNSLTFRTPKTNGSQAYVSSSNTKQNIKSIGFDLFICLDQLQQSDLYLLADKDDYLATITVSWSCAENNCSDPDHIGSFMIRVRGYFQTVDENDEDTFFLVVNPTPDSMSLDIKDLLLNDKTATIANLNVDTTTRRMDNNSVYDWRSHLFVFLSASPDYNSSDQRFLLWNIRNYAITVPYTITVTNNTNSSVKSTFDGTDRFISTQEGNYLDLKDYNKSSTSYYSKSTDRFGKDYYAINYSATVDIDLQDKEVSINGVNVLISTILSHPEEYASRYSSYVGNYQSYIYYHIVYSD